MTIFISPSSTAVLVLNSGSSILTREMPLGTVPVGGSVESQRTLKVVIAAEALSEVEADRKR